MASKYAFLIPFSSIRGPQLVDVCFANAVRPSWILTLLQLRFLALIIPTLSTDRPTTLLFSEYSKLACLSLSFLLIILNLLINLSVTDKSIVMYCRQQETTNCNCSGSRREAETGGPNSYHWARLIKRIRYNRNRRDRRISRVSGILTLLVLSCSLYPL